jgi:hypothetical protein
VIVIEKALGKENIDEVVGLSRTLRERESESGRPRSMHD